MKRLALVAAQGLLVGLLATGAFAHGTWLRAAEPAQVGQPLTLGLTSGGPFPTPDTGPNPERIDRLAASIEGEAQPFAVAGPGEGELLLRLTPARAGLAVITVSLKPRDITLDAAEVEEYLAEADPGPDVRSAWDVLRPKGSWREVYAKHVKRLVCVAPCQDSRAAMTPSGQALEFVALEPGPSPRRLRLLQTGFPAAGRTVWLHVAGAAPRKLVSGSNGEVFLPVGLAGEVMLSSIWLRPPMEMMVSSGLAPELGPQSLFGSDFASIVFLAAT